MKELEKIQSNQDRLKIGLRNSLILDTYFPKLSQYVPAIIPNDYIILAGRTGTGKSRMLRTFIKVIISDAKKYNYQAKVFLNALEETPERIRAAWVLQKLITDYNINMTFYDLMGYKGRIHTLEESKAIEKCYQSFYDEVHPYLDIVAIRQPFGFYKYVREWAYGKGKFYYDQRDNDRIVSSREVDPKTEAYSRFEPHDPNLKVYVATDHILFYAPEKGKSKWETIIDYSKTYCRGMLNNVYNFTVINLSQFSAESEKKQFNLKGQNIVEKLEPDLTSFAEVKPIVDDATIVWGMFYPKRYGIKKHNGFEVFDTMRSMHLLKTREGRADDIISFQMLPEKELMVELK
jgi:hypothetical protein